MLRKILYAIRRAADRWHMGNIETMYRNAGDPYEEAFWYGQIIAEKKRQEAQPWHESEQ